MRRLCAQVNLVLSYKPAAWLTGNVKKLPRVEYVMALAILAGAKLAENGGGIDCRPICDHKEPMDQNIVDALQSGAGLALRDGFVAFIAFWAYKFASEAASKGAGKTVALKALGLCAAIALLGAAGLGRPSCDESDPMRGSCMEYSDDGYTPTDEARVKVFTHLLLLFFGAALCGIANAEPVTTKPNYPPRS